MDGPVHLHDERSGYTWRLVAPHPDGGAWLALRWHGPVFRWSGSHPTLLSVEARERMTEVEEPT